MQKNITFGKVHLEDSECERHLNKTSLEECKYLCMPPVWFHFLVTLRCEKVSEGIVGSTLLDE